MQGPYHSPRNKQSISISSFEDLNKTDNDSLDSSFSYSQQIINIMILSLANISSFVMLWLLQNFNLQFIESLGKNEYISAYALSFQWTNALGYAFIIAMNTGLCGMASQAIGFKKYNLVSSYYQRSQAINIFFMTIFSIIFMFSDKIFQTMTTNDIAKAAQDYITPYIPSMFFFIIFDTTRNIFNSYQLFNIPNYIIMVTYLLHPLWLYLLIYYFNIGFAGAGIARSVTELLNAVIIVTLVWQKGYFKELNLRWTKNAFRGWFGYMRYAIPMGSILYLDWIASDLQTFFVAMSGFKHQMAGHSAFVSIFLLFVVIPLGLSITILTKIGQAIGNGSVSECKRISKLGLICGIIASGSISLVSLIFKDRIGHLFTENQDQLYWFNQIYMIHNFIYIHIGAQIMMLGAIMRAAGKQDVILIIPLIAFFVIGIPLQYYVTVIKKFGIYGAWLSYTFSGILTLLGYIYNFLYINWNKQIKIVQERMQKDQKYILSLEQQEENNQDMDI